MRSVAQRWSRGFTLIELMIVVAIIGILASVAMPQFARAQVRARTAERATIMDAISRAVNDTTANLQGLPTRDPTVPGSGNQWIGDWNPAGVPGPSKRPAGHGAAVAGWTFLPVIIQGGAYYSYRFVVNDPGGNGSATTMSVTAVGDLDGDAVLSSKTINWAARGYTFFKDYANMVVEVPPAGMEDQGTF
jgi:prepilin-type N-terminal cleavage/methylation domain-containing protein